MLKPTQSPALNAQQFGRAIRPPVVNGMIRARYYDLTMSKYATRLYFEIMNDFIPRGFKSPRAYGSYPEPGDKTRITFHLAEELCDEFETRMGIKPDA